MNEAFKAKLGNLCKARFPFILITTWEEDRAMQFIGEVARDSGRVRTPRSVQTWSVYSGLTSDPTMRDEATRDPLKALDVIERTDTPSIFVIKDSQQFLNGQFANGGGQHPDPALIRRLRDLSDHLRHHPKPKNIIFLAPTAKLPTELEKDVHIIDLHLPTAEEIRQLLHDMMAANRESGRIEFALAPEEEERLVKAALGLTLREAENAFAYALVEDGKLSIRDVNVILEEKCQVLKKSDILEFIDTDLGIEDVGGLENLKKWLRKRQNSWMDAAQKYCLPAPKGMLLTGVPGCGKSLVAKAVASAWQLPLLRLDPGKIYSGLMGSSEENIRKATKTAEAIAPCILWIDEIEKGFSQTSGFGDGGTANRVFGSFLSWMQEKTQPVFVIATANNIDALPAELLRKGRFDEIFFVNLPNLSERMSIFYIHLKKRLKHPDAVGNFKMDRETLLAMARKMDGFNGAEIEQVVISALYEAFAENRPLTLADLDAAIENTVPLLVTQAEKIHMIQDWARHRAVFASLPDEPVASPAESVG